MRSERVRVIGIDFDNTLVRYDELLHRIAVQRRLIPDQVEKRKKVIRDAIRQLPGGELEWQQLQALLYGPRISEAPLADGIAEFFESCRRQRVRVYVISHKTTYAQLNGMKTNLHKAALMWMRTNKFFEAEGLGLRREDVYFEPTRREKIVRIGSLRCTHFIDDLEETFLEDAFPANVQKILYAPDALPAPLPGVRIVSSWKEIDEYFFAAPLHT